ncbi:glycosyltransferase family 1 protein [Deefgea sp. CFH1-16]|uniref:glycosyltransferase family 4 protein n=1 Tax=Deefgea sp. CFH1-16 TaxID=2675457 RepID=UPI0015F66FC3|nr:glycosyltransferase family 1 protein [Deefgea sp. CFH1-16]MBM5574148.1 glycosyltransferase [Deefgea sp. CFH1-16]
MHWKTTGVAIHIIVYDLLPVRHPEWFKPKSSQNFHRWLKTIAIFADSAICISNTVKADLNHWLTQQYALNNRLAISTIPLGADLQNSLPSTGLPANIEQQLVQMFQQPAILIVGTLEPRKGHAQVLAAFEKLWQQGYAINLIIAGKAGWQTEDLQHQLSNHPNPSLHWLANASDELLEQLYIRCSGVIVASYAEGFGLPLREAMHYQKPIFARDIAVFREIGDQGIAYFDAHNTEKMHIELAHWLSQLDQDPIIYQTMNETWHDSASALLTNLGLNRP